MSSASGAPADRGGGYDSVGTDIGRSGAGSAGNSMSYHHGSGSENGSSSSSGNIGNTDDAVKQRPVAVFWDAENCPLGRGVAAEAVAGAIAAALKSVGLIGPLQLWYGYASSELRRTFMYTCLD